MKPLPAALALVSLLAGAAFAGSSLFQDSDSPWPTPVAGEEHAVLEHFVGEWDATVRMMGMESKGTMSCKRSMKGLWLIQDYAGSMMGQEFTGHGLTGYDPAKGKYVSVWVDSMTASLDPSEGTWDPEKRELVFLSQGPDPMSGKMVTAKQVNRFSEDGKRMEFRMLMVGSDGTETETLAIDYVRK